MTKSQGKGSYRERKEKKRDLAKGKRRTQGNEEEKARPSPGKGITSGTHVKSEPSGLFIIKYK